MSQEFFILNLKTKEKISFQSGLVFGRTEGCDIQILEKSISRRHASIEKQGDKYFLKDLGSSNGTLLNGTRISEETLFKNGDKIQIGEMEFEVIFSEPPPRNETLNSKPAISLPSLNPGWISLGISFFGKEFLSTQLSPFEYQNRRVQWEALVREYIENHEGNIVSTEECKIFLKWETASISSRFKALAFARTAVLGTRLFWQQYESESPLDLTKVGVTILLTLEEGAETVASMIDQVKNSGSSILASASFLKNWEDKPLGKALAIEGLTDLQALSEI